MKLFSMDGKFLETFNTSKILNSLGLKENLKTEKTIEFIVKNAKIK